MADTKIYQINGAFVPGQDHGIMYQWALSNAGTLPNPVYNERMLVTPTDPVSGAVLVSPGVLTLPVRRDFDTSYVMVVHDGTSNPAINIPDPAAQDYVGALVLLVDRSVDSNPDLTGNGSFVFVQGAEAADPVAPTDAELDTEFGFDADPTSGTWFRLANIDVAFGNGGITANDIDNVAAKAWVNAEISPARYGVYNGGYLDVNNQYIRQTTYVDSDVVFTIDVDESGVETFRHAYVYPSTTYWNNINYAFSLCKTVELAPGTHAPDSIDMTGTNGTSLYGSGQDNTKIVDTNMVTASGGALNDKIAMVRLWEGSTVRGLDLRPTLGGPASRALYGRSTIAAIGNVSVQNVNISDSRHLENAVLLADGFMSAHWNFEGVKILGGGRRSDSPADDALGFNLRTLQNSNFVGTEWESGGFGVGLYMRNIRNIFVSGNFLSANLGDRCVDLRNNDGGTVQNVTLVGMADRCLFTQDNANPINRAAFTYFAAN